MQHSNPFFNRNSIAHPRYFYNRTETVQKVRSLLYNGVCVMVTGPRRIGRSSLLRYLSEYTTHLPDDERAATTPKLFVYVDCAPCQQHLAGVFYASILNRLRSVMIRAGLDASYIPVSASSLESDHFIQVLRAVADQHGQIVLLLDEFDSVYHNPQMDEAFFASLRSLNTEGIVAYCVAMLSQSRSNERVERYGATAAFNSIFIRVPLMPFAPNESRLLIEHQLNEEKLHFRPELVSYVIDQLAGTHPYLLQIAAYEAFEMAVMSEGYLTVRRLDELNQRFYEQAVHHWAAQFEQLSLAERRGLALLNAGIQPSPEITVSLGYAGLLVEREQGWDYLSEAFQGFIRSQQIEGLAQVFLPGDHSSYLHLMLDQFENRAYLNGTLLELSPLPLQLLYSLAERPNQIVSIQELEMRLWPGDKFYEGSDERIRPHIRLLRESLGNAAYIQNRRGLGYMLVTTLI